jgi:hypothetical protein
VSPSCLPFPGWLEAAIAATAHNGDSVSDHKKRDCHIANTFSAVLDFALLPFWDFVQLLPDAGGAHPGGG